MRSRVYDSPWSNQDAYNLYASTGGVLTGLSAAGSPAYSPPLASQDAAPTATPDAPKVDYSSAFGGAAGSAKSIRGAVDAVPTPAMPRVQDYSTYYKNVFGAGTNNTGAGVPASASSSKVVYAASKYLGVMYKWGGTNPATGLDCSGLTQRAAHDAGVSIPRTAAAQYGWFKQKGRLVGIAQAQPGDLVYLRSAYSPSGWHTGIYVGGGKMMDASGRGRPVAVRSINVGGGLQIMGFGRLPATPTKRGTTSSRVVRAGATHQIVV